jgi:hypothetical protein
MFWRSSHRPKDNPEAIFPMKKSELLPIIARLCAAAAGYAQIPAGDINREAKIRADMVVFNPHYKELIAQRAGRLSKACSKSPNGKLRGRE